MGNCASRFAWPTQTAAMHKARGFSSSPVKSDDLFVDGETVRTGRASRELEDKPKGKLVSDLPKDRIKREVWGRGAGGANFAEGPIAACNDDGKIDVQDIIGKLRKKPDFTGENRDVDVNKVATYGIDRKLAAYKAQKKK